MHNSWSLNMSKSPCGNVAKWATQQTSRTHTKMKAQYSTPALSVHASHISLHQKSNSSNKGFYNMVLRFSWGMALMKSCASKAWTCLVGCTGSQKMYWSGWGQHTEGSCTRLSDCPRKMALGSSTPWCLWSPTATAVMILTAMIVQLEVTIMAFQHTRQDRRKKKKKITSLVQVYKWVQHLQLLQTATPV